MGIDLKEVMYKINCLASDMDSLYHRAASKLGLSDSVMLVLYLLYENGGKYPLGNIRRETGMRKQTLNSAVRKLESEGVLRSESEGSDCDGRTKLLRLTEKGKEYADSTVARLFGAECSTFDGWTDKEIHEYLRLTEKYTESFRSRINLL